MRLAFWITFTIALLCFFASFDPEATQEQLTAYRWSAGGAMIAALVLAALRRETGK